MLSETELSRHFARLGVRFQLKPITASDRWALVIVRTKEGSMFELRAGEAVLNDLEVIVSNVNCPTHHLMLLIRAGSEASLHRYLCGQDERDWFAATVPGGIRPLRRRWSR